MVENNKQNTIKLINAKIDTLRNLYRLYLDDGRYTKAQQVMYRITAMQEVLFCLAYEEYFNDIWNIYNPAD